MTYILGKIEKLFSKTYEPVPPGTYHYISPPDDPRNYRLHLRVEPNGNGVLIINASTILHLNQTATEYAYYLIQNKNVDEVVKIVKSRYEISSDQARRDYQDIIDRIQILINTPDLDPVSFLGFERMPPFSGHIAAPYRLDCALTYNLPEGSDPNFAPIERAKQELTTQDWLSIINKAYQVGIPHLIFTGGEPTLREDLPDLLQEAENNNQVTGLLSDGLKLADPDYLDRLLQTGLDHLMLLFLPEFDQSWDILQNILSADLYVAVHLTLNQKNLGNMESVIDRLVAMGVQAISLSTSTTEHEQDLIELRDYVASKNLELVWNLPVPYSSQNPVALESGSIETSEGAGRAWLYIEPDGDVLPAQGMEPILGNFLTDGWEKIWNASLTKVKA